MVSETVFLGGALPGGGRYDDGRGDTLAGGFLDGAGGGDALPGGGRYGDSRGGALAGGFVGGAGGGAVLAGGIRFDGSDGRYDDDGVCGSIFPWRGSVWRGEEPAHGTGGCGVGEAEQRRAERVVEAVTCLLPAPLLEDATHEALDEMPLKEKATPHMVQVAFKQQVVSKVAAHEVFDDMSCMRDMTAQAGQGLFKAPTVLRADVHELFMERPVADVIWDEEFGQEDHNLHGVLLDQLAQYGEYLEDEVRKPATELGNDEEIIHGSGIPLVLLGMDSGTEVFDEMPQLDVIWDEELLQDLDSHIDLVDEMREPTVEPFNFDMLTHNNGTSLLLELGVDPMDELCDERPLEDDGVAKAEHVFKASVSSEDAAQEVFDHMSCETVVRDEQRPCYLDTRDGLLQQLALSGDYQTSAEKLGVDEALSYVSTSPCFVMSDVDMVDALLINSVELDLFGRLVLNVTSNMFGEMFDLRVPDADQAHTTWQKFFTLLSGAIEAEEVLDVRHHKRMEFIGRLLWPGNQLEAFLCTQLPDCILVALEWIKFQTRGEHIASVRGFTSFKAENTWQTGRESMVLQELFKFKDFYSLLIVERKLLYVLGKCEILIGQDKVRMRNEEECKAATGIQFAKLIMDDHHHGKSIAPGSLIWVVVLSAKHSNGHIRKGRSAIGSGEMLQAKSYVSSDKNKEIVPYERSQNPIGLRKETVSISMVFSGIPSVLCGDVSLGSKLKQLILQKVQSGRHDSLSPGGSALQLEPYTRRQWDPGIQIVKINGASHPCLHKQLFHKRWKAENGQIRICCARHQVAWGQATFWRGGSVTPGPCRWRCTVGLCATQAEPAMAQAQEGAGGGLPRLLVCDPVSRRHALLPLPPASARGEFVGAALLSRAGGFEFEATCLTVDAGRLRAWVASFRGGECSWLALPPSGDVEITFDPFWFEQRCVHAAGSLYWHICNNDSALALDPATMEFSFLRAPALMLDDKPFTKYRIGEMPDDGRLCVGALEDQKLQLCVQGTGSLDGWVLERQVCLRKVLDMVPGLPKDHLSRNYCTWLSDVDGGHTGRVFIMTRGRGRFSYNVDTGKLDRLATDDGMEYGHPIFAYFGSPDTRSD
ncbi:hypothetical protein ACP70R_046498 [Stipagrostis hirtigluma subsp. patula]